MLIAPMSAAQDMGPDTGRELYLEVFINGRAVDLITRFVDLGNGVLLADAQELANTGILPDAVGRSGDIRVDQLPGVSYVVDAAAQTLHFTASDAALAAKVIAASDVPEDLSEEPVDTGFGVVLNYNLTVEAQKGSGGSSHFAAGDFDARMFTPIGALSHSFTMAEENLGAEGTAGRFQYRRLDTFWRSPLPRRAVQVQIGDITSRGPSWTRAVRLGGVLFERNFELRPDLVTLPLPDFEGTAAVPSTVEVYSGSIRRFSADLPPGPFTLTDLPFATGSGEAQVILRDVTGRETRVDLPFLVSSDLMRKGRVDYAFAIGHPRLGIGTDSDRYLDALVGVATLRFGVATLRFGLTDSVTVAAHLEAGGGLRMAGVGATFRIGHRGTATLSMARSESAFGSGTLAEASAQLNVGRLRVSGRVLRTAGEFADVARSTAEPVDAASADTPITSLNQLSLTLPVLGQNGAAASLFYADTTLGDGTRDESIGIAYSRPIFNDGTLNLSALAVDGRTSDVVFGLGLHMPLGKRSHAGATLEHRDGAFRQSVSASGRSSDRARGWDWRMQATREAQTSVQASAGRAFRYGRLEAAARISDGQQSLGLRAQGALVVAGGGVFLSGYIHDSFAVVDAGVPGVDVRFENRVVGTTGWSGKMLVPGLRSYDNNSLSIDPATLPIDADVPMTREVIRPAHRSGVKVDFGVQANPASAVVELLGADGEPLPVGLPAVLVATGESFLIGYDGMVYALGLEPENQIVVTRTDGSQCSASFGYRDEPGTISQIDGVICQ